MKRFCYLSLTLLSAGIISYAIGTHRVPLDKKAKKSSTATVETSIIDPNGALPTGTSSYYDIDGDGVMEIFEDNSVNSFDLKTGLFGKNQYDYKTMGAWPDWCNLNNDEYLDFIIEDKERIDSDNNYLYYFTFNSGEGNGLYQQKKDTIADGYSEFFPLDFNNDGYPDLVYDRNQCVFDGVYTLHRNGNLQWSEASIVSEKEYRGTVEYKSHSGLISTSVENALNYPLTVSVSYIKEIEPYNVDIDGDGILDYIASTYYIHNLGNGIGIKYNLQGVVFADTNNDGIMEIIKIGEELTITYVRRDGTSETKILYTAFNHDGNIWCYDFDKDGDTDILIAYDYCAEIGYSKDPGGSYLLLAENLGNEQFKCHENYYPEYIHFASCVDFDSDGNYEVICAVENNTKNSDGYYTDRIGYLRIDGMTIGETVADFATPLSHTTKDHHINNTYEISVGDLDNSGIMHLCCDWALMPLSTTVNQRPDKPQSPTFTYETSTGLLKINWQPGIDKESSSNDLTYALRIGTAPGKGDIVYAHALADGTRRNMRGGNQNRNRMRLINTQSWSEGKYYISVQAIDPNNRGSQFSDEVVFEKMQPANTFEIRCQKRPFGVGDTCMVMLNPNINVDNTLQWNITDGNIVKKSTDGRTLYIVFDKSGNKTISLQVTNDRGQTSIPFARNIDVQAVSTQANDYVLSAFDMDEDGCMEYYSSKKFHTYAPDGTASPINKMWNNNNAISNLSLYAMADVNNDGKCDIVQRKSGSYYGHERSFSVFVNEGDKVLSIPTGEASIEGINYIDGKLCDLDNDGVLEYMHYDRDNNRNYFYNIYKTDDKYTSFYLYKRIDNLNGKMDGDIIHKYKDCNNDGLIDLIIEESDYDAKMKFFISYTNNGDCSFARQDTLYSYAYESLNGSFLAIEDFDNNGKYDMLYQEKGGKYHILWDNDSKTFLENVTYIPDGILLFDFNNDGVLDIACNDGYSGLGDGRVALLYADHTTSYEELSEDSNISGDIAFVTPTGDIVFSECKLKSNNTRPDAPTNITVGKSVKGINISWRHATDKETPECRMRYNISVKHKGTSGEGAYLISPCNSTKNNVHVPTHKDLIEGNNFLIPTASIPAGEYEVQVQAIDGQMLESDFSTVYYFTVADTYNIEAPGKTEIGVETHIKINSNTEGDIDFDGGTTVSQEANLYTVVWNEEGYKTITAGNESCEIYVQAKPDASFTIPGEVLLNARVNVHAADARNSIWQIAEEGKEFTPIADSNMAQMEIIDNENAILRLTQTGNYTVRHSIESEFGVTDCDMPVVVTDRNATPEIQLVTAKEGVLHIVWNNPTDLSTDVTGINIYKEGAKSDEYVLLAQVDRETVAYNDTTSNPDIQSARYRMSYTLTYGESVMSTPHQSMHVMINRGTGTDWNLVWSSYEGRKVDTYRILRGTTPTELAFIADVSGNMNSYTDAQATTDETLYYAIEIVVSDELQALKRNSKSEQVATSRSNIVSTQDVHESVLTESIEIAGETNITRGVNTSVELMAILTPYYVTYQSVNWVIESGNDIATIDENGVVSVSGNGSGTVVVRAYAIDGSGVYGEAQIEVSGFKKFEEEQIIVNEVTDTTTYSFTINWEEVYDAEYYTVCLYEVYGDTTMVVDYDNLNIGNTTSYNFANLIVAGEYLYTIQAHKGSASTAQTELQKVRLREPYPWWYSYEAATTDITQSSFTLNFTVTYNIEEDMWEGFEYYSITISGGEFNQTIDIAHEPDNDNSIQYIFTGLQARTTYDITIQGHSGRYYAYFNDISISVETSHIDLNTVSDTHCYVENGQLIVEASVNNMVTLYNISGQTLFCQKQTAEKERYNLPCKGIYIVRVNDAIYKISCK